MDETMLKLRILARAELTLARANFRRMVIRMAFGIIAIGMILLMVVMLNLGAYELFAASLGSARAAFVVAAINGALATLVFLLSTLVRPGPEQEMVREIREMALTELASDAAALQGEFAEIGQDVHRIRDGLSSFMGGGDALWSSLGPVIAMLIEALKRRNA
jgi:hypothetical protein